MTRVIVSHICFYILIQNFLESKKILTKTLSSLFIILVISQPWTSLKMKIFFFAPCFVFCCFVVTLFWTMLSSGMLLMVFRIGDAAAHDFISIKKKFSFFVACVVSFSVAFSEDGWWLGRCSFVSFSLLSGGI